MSRQEPSISYVDLISKINGRVAAPSMSEDARRELIAFAVNLLVEVGEYRGFRYVYPGGDPIPVGEVKKGHYDEHRVRFFTPASGRARSARV